jgi:RIO kinase 1
VRPHDDSSPVRTHKRRFDDDETFAKRTRPRQLEAIDDTPDEGSRWSTWDQSTPLERGPRPHPDWLVTELAAVDTELGVLKTGKEADVFLVERGIPGTDRSCLLAAKRYRDSEHRMFHRDAGYLEGRRVRESRTNRAMSSRTAFGRQVIAAQWAAAEFGALCGLWQLGVPVPYPVQILGTEVLLQFLGSADGSEAAPRLAQLRADTADLPDLWRQLVEAMSLMARGGACPRGPVRVQPARPRWTVGGHRPAPGGRRHLQPQRPGVPGRDARNVAGWFASHGVPEADGDELTALLLADAGVR